MCIAAIIHKPISWDYLREMESDNPHGAGVAWAQDGTLRFKKGLTASDILGMQEWGELTYPYLLHFRWATHGKKVPQLTHPFPLGPRALFGELEGSADALLIHNGVWSTYEKYLPLVTAVDALIEEASDTAIAAYLVGVYNDESILKNLPWACAVAKLDESGAIAITKHGSTWSEHEGNQYSNMQWLPAKDWQSYFYKPHQAGTINNYPARPGITVLDNYPTFPNLRSGWSVETPEGQAEIEKEVEQSGNATVITAFDGWEDYVRARYGDECADEIKRDALTMDGLAEFGEGAETDSDLVSEDPTEVNAWLAKEYLKKVSAA